MEVLRYLPLPLALALELIVYILLIMVLVGVGLFLLWQGSVQRRAWQFGLGICLLLATPAFFAVTSFWGEMLWFQALGFNDRFFTVLSTRLGLACVAAIVGAVVVWMLTSLITRKRNTAKFWPEIAAGALGALWGFSNWQLALKFWHQSSTETFDPILGFDVSFYLFTLPLLSSLSWLLLGWTLLAIAAGLMSAVDPRRLLKSSEESQSSEGRTVVRVKDLSWNQDARNLLPIQLPAGGLVLVLSVWAVLSAFNLLYSRHGVVHGPGWTDVHVRLPAYFLVAALLAVAGVVLIVDSVVRRLRENRTSRRRLMLTGTPLAGAALCWFVGLIALPGLFQWLYVQPNEVSVERPYIENNIRFTRQAFKLDKVEEYQFPVSEEFDQRTVERNSQILSQVRLWDPRALDAVYKQFQEIRLYYEFADVDVDRYNIDGQYQQVMVSPREMALQNLPQQSQTFVNRRFKYTHGYGLTMAPVSEFTSGGLPNLLIKDLPPQTTSSDLQVQRPEIYYGQLTNSHVIVNSKEEEFDYPSGEHNVYNHYSGTGGVRLSNLWRRFVYGWMFDGTRLFVSSYPTNDSRIMFHRGIQERVRTLAPFLHFDEDAYVVLDEGKLFWIVDGYTTSRYYPYSEPFVSRDATDVAVQQRDIRLQMQTAEYLRGTNYMRNSVKAVVDAFDGSVELYVYDEEDPIIKTWQSAFPGLLKPRQEMPDSLRAHVRYPEGLLLVQGLIYARYHMTDPDVFYNQEDVWVRATEKYYANVQPVQPYYVMWKQPAGTDQSPDDKQMEEQSMKTDTDSGQPEFILMQPFTPKNRQVLIGWIAGMCDGENYGRLLSYRFPKEKRVLGTQQVETKIDQDPQLSQQLSLWDQRGSRVVRGNVLAIPVNSTLLYVEPIYLQAEAAAYPELRLVAVMHNDRLSYADNFDAALQGLYSDDQSPQQSSETTPIDASLAQLAEQAGREFDNYLQSLGDRNFDAANRHLKQLSSTLEKLDRLDTEVAQAQANDGSPRESVQR